MLTNATKKGRGHTIKAKTVRDQAEKGEKSFYLRISCYVIRLSSSRNVPEEIPKIVVLQPSNSILLVFPAASPPPSLDSIETNNRKLMLLSLGFLRLFLFF